MHFQMRCGCCFDAASLHLPVQIVAKCHNNLPKDIVLSTVSWACIKLSWNNLWWKQLRAYMCYTEYILYVCICNVVNVRGSKTQAALNLPLTDASCSTSCRAGLSDAWNILSWSNANSKVSNVLLLSCSPAPGITLQELKLLLHSGAALPGLQVRFSSSIPVPNRSDWRGTDHFRLHLNLPMRSLHNWWPLIGQRHLQDRKVLSIGV